MNTFFINLAGFFIRISFNEKKDLDSIPLNEKLKLEILEYTKNFLVSDVKKIDFHIEIEALPNPTLLLRTKEKHMYISYFEQKTEKKIKTYREISIFQFQFLLRTILDRLLGKTKGFMLHASSVCIDRSGYIFVGNPGSGKSTAAQNLSKKYRQLSDDTVVLRNINGIYYLFQTPFIEKNRFPKKAAQFPLKGIFFLRKSTEFKIKLLRDKEYILKKLLEQNLTEDSNIAKRTKPVMKLVAKYNYVYLLYFGKKYEDLIQLFENFSAKPYV